MLPQWLPQTKVSWRVSWLIWKPCDSKPSPLQLSDSPTL